MLDTAQQVDDLVHRDCQTAQVDCPELPSHNSAFNALKHALTVGPTLATPHPDKESELGCYASG